MLLRSLLAFVILCPALLALCPALLAQTGSAGNYKGKWNGMSASGDFQLKLEQSSGDWKATVQFTFADTAIPTKVKAVAVDGGHIDVTYDFDLAGNKLESHLEGEMKDGLLKGKYKTKALADGSGVDEGTWEAKRAE